MQASIRLKTRNHFSYMVIEDAYKIFNEHGP